MMKYRKIGERFSTSKGTFEVVEGHCSDGCVFWTGKNNPLSNCRINAFARQIFGECYTIDEGFHSYSENVVLTITERGYEPLLRIDVMYEGRILNMMWGVSGRDNPVILECRILEGSTYCENEWGELVSEAITVDSIIIIDEHKEKG